MLLFVHSKGQDWRVLQRIKILLCFLHWYCYAFLRSFCLLARDSLELFQMDRQWQFWLEILRTFSRQRYQETSIAWIVLLDLIVDICFAFFLITETRLITIPWFVIRSFPYCPTWTLISHCFACIVIGPVWDLLAVVCDDQGLLGWASGWYRKRFSQGVGNLQLCTSLPEVRLQFWLRLKPNLQPAQFYHFPFLSQHKLQVALAAIHAPARSKFAGQEDPGHCRCSRCHRVDAGKSPYKRGNAWQRG